jgi:DNA-nicking Smr family endonuclease
MAGKPKNRILGRPKPQSSSARADAAGTDPLWQKLVKSIRPLGKARDEISLDAINKDKNRKRTKASNATDAPANQGASGASSGTLLGATTPPKPLQDIATPSPLDTRDVKRVKRGKQDIDATLDLHGLTAASAHARLETFILTAHASGYRWVLVVTGKGKAGNGILRQALPEWISLPPLSKIVLGLSQASPAHGGSGAFYLRLRKAPERRAARNF